MSTEFGVARASRHVRDAAEATDPLDRLTLESVWGLSHQPGHQPGSAPAKARVAHGGPGNDRIAARLVVSSTCPAQPATKVMVVVGGRSESVLSKQAAREACAALASPFQGISVELDDAADLAMYLTTDTPRIVVIDASVCELLGAAALHQARRRFPATDWLIAWEQPSPHWLPILIETQARGAVEAGCPSAQLARALDAVMAGQLWFSRPVLQWVHAELMRNVAAAPETVAHGEPAVHGAREALSTREAESIALMRLGLTNKEIGDRLNISVNTVKKHLGHAFEKMGLHTRRQCLG